MAPWRDHCLDLLQAYPEDLRSAGETDYRWNYRADPLVTPLMIQRWEVVTDSCASTLRGCLSSASAVVGVGSGGENRMADMYGRFVKSYVVVEPSFSQLASLEPHPGTDVVPVRAFGEQLPLPDGWAHLVELYGVLDHVVDPLTTLREARRVLRPGGCVAITLTNVGSWYRRLAARLGLRPDHTHAHEFDVESVSRLLREAGLDVTHSSTAAYLRLPRPVERLLGRRLSASAQRHLVRSTDAVLRQLVGRHQGGMMLVVGCRPHSPN